MSRWLRQDFKPCEHCEMRNTCMNMRHCCNKPKPDNQAPVVEQIGLALKAGQFDRARGILEEAIDLSKNG